MKRLIFGSLSALLLSTSTLPVFATEKTSVNRVESSNTQSSITQLEPLELVNLAYQGYFSQQGIPGYSDFLLAIRQKEISAEDIVQVAVNTRKVPSQALSDEEYLNAVKVKVDALANTADGSFN
ncbi:MULTISPECIES: hypothetical protein [Nostocales]|uniref:Uncharacterized protein n=3 Tax=Nostocales TaxID=1161 RepID=A0A8S9SYR2_9CYAN|nr:hypothetical protein [Tolypothrix bouteillei]KAF3884988.1 hypothetical protein DA73_0400005560 [Tolypothrix bouteillei VB521301]